MLNEEMLKKLTSEQLTKLIEKKTALKKFKTVKQLKEELSNREDSKNEPKKRKKAGSQFSKVAIVQANTRGSSEGDVHEKYFEH